VSLLLEREPLIASLGAYLAEAVGGRGRLVFVGGEAGSGKTSVVTHFSGVVDATVRVLHGACDGGEGTPRPLGPLADVASALGTHVEEQLALDQPKRGRLFSAVRAALAMQPTVLVLEDVHWADEATLYLIRFLARRLDGIPLLLVTTYRDDEVHAGHPLTTLIRQSGKGIDAAELYQRTGGNPFYVTEAISADTDRVPPSVRDAVLARCARLTPAGQAVLAAASVIGMRCDVPLLIAVSGQSPDALDECVEHGVLLDAGDQVAFRHELARQAIDESLPSARRLRLHQAVLDNLRGSGATDDQQLAHHAERSGDAAAVVLHAPRAAERAARLGSHREAAAHYLAALRHGDDLTDSVRADILEALSYECYLTDQIAEALAARTEALVLRKQSGEPRLVGNALRWLSRLSWFNGRNDDAERYATEAVDTLEPLGPSPQLAMAYSNVSQLRMLADDVDSALSWGDRAIDLGRMISDQLVLSHALNNVGTARLHRGEVSEGTVRLEQSLDIALATESEEHAARAYTNLGASHVELRLLATAEQYLRDGIDYCVDRDLDTWRLYMEAWLARAVVESGRYDDALRLTRGILRHPHLSPITQMTALTVTALVAVRHDDPAAEAMLDQAETLAGPTGEAQRVEPVAAARAELAWTHGSVPEILDQTDAAWRAALARGTRWRVGELAWWRFVAGERSPVPVDVAEPYALMLSDHAREAAAAWAAIGSPWWEALALARSAELSDTRKALKILDGLGAMATARAVIRDLRLRGLPVPRGPRSTTLDNPAGLTERELEVLQLLTVGLSNAEVAQRLTLSEKTVGHHVSAVLRKLGARSRSRAVVMAAEMGIGVSRQHRTWEAQHRE
jgi:DNA-binding CsgD family transcriptional regulator/tetratricopeptide (TPR) repeat protein